MTRKYYFCSLSASDTISCDPAPMEGHVEIDCHDRGDLRFTIALTVEDAEAFAREILAKLEKE